MSETNTVSPLRQRMLEDMAARKLNPHTQRSHISSCKRFAAWLKRSPDTATPDEVRRFQLHLIESGASIGSWRRPFPSRGHFRTCAPQQSTSLAWRRNEANDVLSVSNIDSKSASRVQFRFKAAAALA